MKNIHLSFWNKYSARGNQLNVTFWMLRNYPSEMVKNACNNIIFGAVMGDHIEMLEWKKSHLPVLIIDPSDCPCDDVSPAAVQ